MFDMALNIESSWKKQLADEFEKDYLKSLSTFLRKEKAENKIIYPKGSDIFNAFDYTPYQDVKVVILGQDPYHGPNQAHGLCFSVKPPVPPPPSLVNIFKELKADLDIDAPNHGSLVSWAKQGILLLNSVLTVEHGKAASHQGKGWEHFTDVVIEKLNQREEPIVFVLWGAYAQKKGQKINLDHHIVLKSAHPSPLSAHRGFLGSRVFSKINEHLKAVGHTPIDWAIPRLSDDEIEHEQMSLATSS